MDFRFLKVFKPKNLTYHQTRKDSKIKTRKNKNGKAKLRKKYQRGIFLNHLKRQEEAFRTKEAQLEFKMKNLWLKRPKATKTALKVCLISLEKKKANVSGN